MLNWLLEKLAGSKMVAVLQSVQAFFSGTKTYIGGSIMILQGLSCLVEQIVGLKGMSDAVALVRGLHDNACLTQISLGLVAIGLRAAVAKLNAPKPTEA